jgi:hypothetical protein
LLNMDPPSSAGVFDGVVLNRAWLGCHSPR